MSKVLRARELFVEHHIQRSGLWRWAFAAHGETTACGTRRSLENGLGNGGLQNLRADLFPRVDRAGTCDAPPHVERQKSVQGDGEQQQSLWRCRTNIRLPRNKHVGLGVSAEPLTPHLPQGPRPGLQHAANGDSRNAEGTKQSWFPRCQASSPSRTCVGTSSSVHLRRYCCSFTLLAGQTWHPRPWQMAKPPDPVITAVQAMEKCRATDWLLFDDSSTFAIASSRRNVAMHVCVGRPVPYKRLCPCTLILSLFTLFESQALRLGCY